MAPTIKEIAKLAGVSIATVSRALANDPKVIASTKSKIDEIARKINYQPNLLARNFVKGTSNLIGLILPHLYDEFYSDIIKGVEKYAQSNGYYTLVTSSSDEDSLSDSIANFTSGGLSAGFIIMLTSENDEIVEQLRHSHTPLVVISDKSLSREFNSVTINNYEASYKLCKHVFSKKKYSSVKYISGPKSNIDSQMRRDGFKDACREFSIPIKKKDIIEGDFTFESGEKICKEFFSEEKIPELILTGNDMMALGCIKVINKNKLKLGEEIFIAGIDGIILGQMISPRLTTMKIQTELIGTNAVKMLLEQMKNNNHKHRNSNVVTELLKGNTI